MTTDDDVDISPRPTTDAHARRTLTAIIIRRPSPGGQSNHARKQRATAIAIVDVVIGGPGRVGVIGRATARASPSANDADSTGRDLIPELPPPPFLLFLAFLSPLNTSFPRPMIILTVPTN